MDKETLSNYGWIVICILVLSVMIALATPFGNFVKTAVQNTTQGLFDVQQKAMGVAGLVVENQGFGNNSNSSNTNMLPIVGKTAEEYTWTEIKAISEAKKGNEYFNIGDTKTFITTDDITIIMEIVAFDADENTNGSTVGITWISRDIIFKHKMNSTNSNKGGWETSEMRLWLNNEIYSTLPLELQNAIVTVNKSYGYANNGSYTTGISKDNLWIPSYREIKCQDDYETFGTMYSNYFSDNTSRIKKNLEGNPAPWFLRSAPISNGVFGCVANEGITSNVNSTIEWGVVIGFCT